MSSRSTRRRVARSLAGAIAVCAVATPVATAASIDAGLHLRGHGAAQTIRSQPVATSFVLADRATPQATPPVRTPPAARSFVLADRATPQAAPSTSHVLADRVSTHGPVVVASSPSASDDGFDWGSAGIGGGIVVLALGLGAGLAAGSRRHSGSPA
jgi:hypothetical protein